MFQPGKVKKLVKSRFHFDSRVDTVLSLSSVYNYESVE